MSEPLLNSRQLKEETIRLDSELKSLRIAYEKYFIGIDKREPQQLRAKFKAKLRNLRAGSVKSTAMKFKLGQLQASLVTMENHWNRICRQIEEGTYKRDRLKAKKQSREFEDMEKQNSKELNKQLATAAKSEPQEATAKSAAAPKTPAKTAAKAPKSSDLSGLHREFQQAREANGIGGKVSLAALEKTVAKQTAVMREKLKCDRVNFRVAVKDGRVILKASRAD